MSNGLIPAVASLAGVAVGALTTFVSQDRNWKRETRRRLYGAYIGKSIIWLDALDRLAFTLRQGWPAEKRAEWWNWANQAKVEVAALQGEIGMVARPSTWDRAGAVHVYLRRLHDEIYSHQENSTTPGDGGYQEAFQALLDGFASEGGKEVGIYGRAR